MLGQQQDTRSGWVALRVRAAVAPSSVNVGGIRMSSTTRSGSVAPTSSSRPSASPAEPRLQARVGEQPQRLLDAVGVRLAAPDPVHEVGHHPPGLAPAERTSAPKGSTQAAFTQGTNTLPPGSVFAEECRTTKTLTEIVVELSLELHPAREELASLRQVPHFGARVGLGRSG